MTPAVLLTFILVVVAASGRLTLAGSCVRKNSDDGQVRNVVCSKDPSQATATIQGITDVAGAGEFEVCCAKKVKRCRRPRPWKPARVISQDGNSVTVSTEKCKRKRIAQALRWGCDGGNCDGCELEQGEPEASIPESPDRR